MAYVTKADWFTNYRGPLVDPDTHYCYSNFYHPDINGGNRVNIILGYNRLKHFAYQEWVADRLIAHSSITSNDSIIIVGGAYGWTGEWLEQKTGAAVVSVDPLRCIN